ncbi:O-antigen ligase family protein [candidate division TA06 bacterium]|nr:O-antigen ligase family protein [candidate division TA06 bacterium]
MLFTEYFWRSENQRRGSNPRMLLLQIFGLLALVISGWFMGWGINNGFLSLILLFIFGSGIAFAGINYPLNGLLGLLLVTPLMGFIMRLGIIPNVGAATDLIMLACMGGFVFNKKMSIGFGQYKQHLVVLTITYLLWGIVEVINPQNPSISVALFGYRGDVFPAITFFLALFLIEDRHLAVLKTFFLVLIWLCGLYAIKQMIFGWTAAEAWWIRETPVSSTGGIRYFSTMISAGVFGTYMLFMFFISLSWFKRGQGFLLNLFYLLTALLCVFCIFACQVRGIWVGFAAGLMFYLLFKKGSKIYRFLAFSVAVAFIIILFDIAAKDTTDDPFLAMVNSLRNPKESVSVQGRLGALATTWIPTVMGHPLGLGAGSVGGSRGQAQSALGQNDSRSVYITDNYYATIATNYGWPGLFLLLAVFVVSAATAYKISRRDDFPHHSMSASLFALMMAVIVLTFSGGIETIPVSIYFWFFVGLLAQWNSRLTTGGT